MDKRDVDSLIVATPSLEKFRVDLEKMVPGAYCLHGSFGIGKLMGYDADKSRLMVEFGSAEPRPMDPVFCIRKLEILQNDDMLVRFHEDPEGIRQKMKKSSIALLIEYLEKMPHRRASLGDIERTFGEIVEEKNFKRWWNVTRKLIAKEPRLSLEEKNVTHLKLCDQPVSEEEQLLQQFESGRDVQKKISIAEKFLSLLKSNPALANFGTKIVEDLAGMCSTKTKKITAAERFESCVIRDEMAKLVGMNIDAMSPKLETLVMECPNLAKVCDNLRPNYYTAFLELVTRVFPDEWEKLCFGILKNCNDRLTNDCIVYLRDNGCEDAVRTTFAKWLREKSLRMSLLQWIVKNRHAKKFEAIFSQELMSHELLRAIFWAIDNEALLWTGKSKKIPLVELLCNDRTLIRDLLASAADDVAADLAQTLLVNQGIDNLSKKSLLARFIAEFPGIQELVLVSSNAKLPQEISLKVSMVSLEAKRREYDVLIREKIPSNKKAIETAREHGDLSENSEYKMARQDQETLLARKVQLEEELRMAQVVDFGSVDTSMVSIGSVVKLRQVESGESIEYTILGAWDSDPAKNMISYRANMAQMLLGKKENDIVETVSDDNRERWKIESICAYGG
ncbi:MAG: GreA/GreB family elongation factor [Puniceicoccales bacterium]|jgi:transcription elongation GreA/GreB family factor|nr:GreA/GreB family elongation factor [Puniceicoccales bacterium]